MEGTGLKGPAPIDNRIVSPSGPHGVAGIAVVAAFLVGALFAAFAIARLGRGPTSAR